MRFHKVPLIIWTSLLLPAETMAGEGLFLSQPEAKILRAWDGTVLILNRSGFTSGFLIHRERIKDKEHYFFLTAGHSLSSIGIRCNAPPSIPPAERKAKVYRNLQLERDLSSPTGIRITNGITYTMTPSWAACELGLQVDTGIMTFTADEDHTDLPVLRFSLDPQKSKPGAKNFVIGFPDVTLRRPEDQRTPLELPEIVSKRWSVGFLSGEEPGEQKYFGTSADSLPGNSGGPVVDDNGDVVGLEVANNFCFPSCSYDGREEDGLIKAWTYYYPKENLIRFSTSRISEIRALALDNAHE